jgi:hypothetical protein
VWPVFVAATIVGVALFPVFRVGIATTMGENPDAHLVTGAAEVVRKGPATSIQPDLPVDRVSGFWQSKYPIFYSLAAVSWLSGLDPVEAFTVLSALLLGLFAVGIFLLAFYVVGAGPVVSLAAMGLAPLDRVALYLVEHPYYNQLWGTFALPFMLLFGYRYLRQPSRRALGLAALFLLIGIFAYPLMLPFPAVALGVTALVMWRRSRATGESLRWVSALRLPRPKLKSVPWAPLWVLLGLFVLVLGYGVADKGLGAVSVIFGGSLNGWQGDSPDLPLGRYFGLLGPTGLAVSGAVALGAAALVALRRLPRAEAIGLGAMLAGALLMALNFALRDFGEYFYFKVMAFTGPLVVALGVVGLGSLARGAGSRAVRALGAAGLAAVAIAFVANTRNELEGVNAQASSATFQLRDWAAKLPAGRSVRLDIPPSGVQLWAAYMLHTHPLSAALPVYRTTYPHVPKGRKADYVLVQASQPRPTDAAGPPVLRNGEFSLYRMNPTVPGPDRSSRTRIQP